MKRALATLLTVASLWLATGGVLFAADFQVFDLWPGAAPGETGDGEALPPGDPANASVVLTVEAGVCCVEVRPPE